MSDISPISQPNPAALNAVQRNGSPASEAKSPSRGSDRVELSQEAQSLSQTGKASDIRQDLVAHVRSELEAGTYETPEKLDTALDELGNDLA